jgi:hypothetical protein
MGRIRVCHWLPGFVMLYYGFEIDLSRLETLEWSQNVIGESILDLAPGHYWSLISNPVTRYPCLALPKFRSLVVRQWPKTTIKQSPINHVLVETLLLSPFHGFTDECLKKALLTGSKFKLRHSHSSPSTVTSEADKWVRPSLSSSILHHKPSHKTKHLYFLSNLCSILDLQSDRMPPYASFGSVFEVRGGGRQTCPVI